MKKSALLSLFLFFFTSTYGQEYVEKKWFFGLKGGLGVSNVGDFKVPTLPYENTSLNSNTAPWSGKSRSSQAIGFWAHYMYKRNSAFAFGVQYSSKGGYKSYRNRQIQTITFGTSSGNTPEAMSDFGYTFNYVELPAMLIIKTSQEKVVNIFAGVGMAVAICTKGKAYYNEWSQTSSSFFGPTPVKEEQKEYSISYNAYDLPFIATAGLQFNLRQRRRKILLDFTFEQGIMSPHSGISPNASYIFSLGYLM